MCGIVGYVGYRSVSELLLEGLHRLEYRGYDSAGIAVLGPESITIRKKAGRVAELAELLKQRPVVGQVGIGHTRWATHGGTTDQNSHPHLGGNGQVAIVHNGVIENYDLLRRQLQQLGYVFHSQTDTELLKLSPQEIVVLNHAVMHNGNLAVAAERSEERRVGKECCR